MKRNRGSQGVQPGKFPDAIQQKLQQAIILHQQGRLSEAKAIYESILGQQPNHFDALNLLGAVAYQTRNLRQAVDLIGRAIKVNPNIPSTYVNRGIAFQELKRADEALASCDKAIALKPDYADAYNNRGYALQELTRLDEALASFDKAIALKPNYAEAYINRGNVLQNLRRHDEALVSYDKAIALNPDRAESYSNRGIALKDLKRLDEALASYDKAIVLKPNYAEAYNNRGYALQELRRLDEAIASYDKAIALMPDYAEAYNSRGNALQELKRLDEAIASYDKAIALKPDYAAYNNRGIALQQLKRMGEALVSYDKAIALKPDYADAYNNRGYALQDLKRLDEALASYDKAIVLKSDRAEVYYNRGITLQELKRFDEAFTAFDKAFALKPDLVGAEGARLYAKQQICDWTDFDTECAHLISCVENKKANTPPFWFLGISSSCDEQLQCAKLWVAEKQPPSRNPIWNGEYYRHDRIRVAYISADFRDHAMAHLMAGIFECHDKSRFDVTAISFGPDDDSEMRHRLQGSFEHFIDAKAFSDERIATLVRSSEVDILVDLMGFTKDSRTGIFARRAAPIQVSYLGYPGTIGAEYIDYVIADQIVIPETRKQSYAEKTVSLPNSYYPTSYQINEDKRSIPASEFTRTELGLPQTSIVFCCFNNNYKITPHVFDSWMRILKQVDGSVLWLLAANMVAENNLRREAIARGINSDRLIFAKRMPLPDHLARHRQADLFLDTLPINAHTTASDALWAGLPVLTCIGETFASRVAASLLNAICLPELVTATPEAYEQMAIDLAMHPDKLANIKRKVAANRLTAPLFDTKLFTKHVEAAYVAMYERYQAGGSPDHIVIAN